MTLYSKTFCFEGEIGKRKWLEHGYQDVIFYANPWEAEGISILKVALNLSVFAPNTNDVSAIHLPAVFVGNSVTADAMTGIHRMIAARQLVVDTMLPEPGMLFGGSGDGPLGPHIDVHTGAASPAGARYEGHLVLWYRKL